MMIASDRTFDGDAPEADMIEQLTPVDVDDDDAGLGVAVVRISPYADADEADLIEQAMVVAIDDDLEFDR